MEHQPMSGFPAICCLTTCIALASVVWSGDSSLQRQALPWTAGVLLGVSIFWILPEMAEDRGWVATLTGVSGILLLLGWINRHVYPICPFCAAGMHTRERNHKTNSCRGALTFGWPLLVFTCVHTFFDGWMIALTSASSHSSSAAALSWGATVHKLPESVAIEVLAARLTSSRKLAFAAVFLIQAAMTSGGLLSILVGNLDARWAGVSAVPACAFLLLFGLLTLHQEWRLNGHLAAVRAAIPGLLGSGLVALATTKFVR
jgi:zinc transporter ZupT